MEGAWGGATASGAAAAQATSKVFIVCSGARADLLFIYSHLRNNCVVTIWVLARWAVTVRFQFFRKRSRVRFRKNRNTFAKSRNVRALRVYVWEEVQT